ncbi:patatin-like phospholipase family protein [Aliihoeflea sp. PC F10.4]
MESETARSTPDPAGPTFALALGGGGARGLSHIHVIETLDELGIRPKMIAGSSIGAIMGAGMAAGMTGRDIREFAHLVLGRRGEVVSRLWRARPQSLSEMVQGGFKLGQFNLERILRSFLPAEIPQTFEQLQIPLKVTGTDFFAHDLAVLDSGDLPSALAASSALPAIFRPVRREGRLLIDGGFYDPVPFDLVGDHADIVIAVDVVGYPSKQSAKNPDSVDLLFGASQIMMQSIIALNLTRCQPQILIRPPVSEFRVLDFLKMEQVMNATDSVRDELKRAIERAVEAHEKKITEA